MMTCQSWPNLAATRPEPNRQALVGLQNGAVAIACPDFGSGGQLDIKIGMGSVFPGIVSMAGPIGAGWGTPYAVDVNAGWRLPFTGLLRKEPP